MVPAGGQGMRPGQYAGDNSTALVSHLGPGMALKGGRYRILQRFHTSSALESQGNEPPLLVASDSELPNGRVLVQELLLGTVRREGTEHLRRLVAQRLDTLAQMPGMPKLVDNFSEHGRHFIVFELPTGEALHDRMQRARGALEETAASNYMLQVLDVLTGFERQRPQFIHGNISPANIILRPSGQVTLVGFSPTLLIHPDGIVEHGAAGGVPGYAAPEQARGQATSRSDLFSLCAVLHHAVTGVAPAPRGSALHAPARRLNPAVSLEMEEALSQGLRPAAAQRYHSAAELRRVLHPLASGRRTQVPEDLRVEAQIDAKLAPVRDAHGRLVLPKKRASQNPLLLVGLIAALILIFGGGGLFAIAPHPWFTSNAAPTATPNDVAALYQSQGIGLSGGEYVFDTDRSNNTLKQTGARALASGDLRTALTSYQDAVAADHADAEAAIYAEDLQVLVDKAPYVTIVVGVAFGNDNVTSEDELQGAYLAQRSANAFSQLPGNTRVRVLILNSGQSVDGTTRASQLLLNQINKGNTQHLVGLIGWPTSDQTKLAISALLPSGLPIVSPTSTDDTVKAGGAIFYAMAPNDTLQGTELADAAITQMSARHILVLSDPQNPTSTSLATSFMTQAKQEKYLLQGVAVSRVNFTTTITTNFANEAHAAAAQGDDLIFVAGNDQDSLNVAQAVSAVNHALGTSLRVLASSHAFTPSLLGVGVDATAKAVHANPDVLSALYVATLADQNEWITLGVNKSAPLTFSNDYLAQFGADGVPSGLNSPDSAAILSFDSVHLLLNADTRGIRNVNGALVFPTPNEIRQRLLQFGPDHPFMGLSGAVAFNQSGTLQAKSFGILQLVSTGVSPSGKAIVRPQVYAVAGGQALFCGTTDCTLT
jgi:ABC-type branched-subunit amino acid transport system substrate-binding protein/serine/threonine protein kinase